MDKFKILLIVITLLLGGAVSAADYHDDKPYPVGATSPGKVTVLGAVLDDTATDALNENDAGYLRMSSSRELLVDVTSASGLPVLVDDAAFTPGTSNVMMAGFEFDDTTPDSVNEGDAGAARMSANRNLYTQIRDHTAERSAGVDASNQLTVVDSAGNTLLGTIDTDTGNIATSAAILDDWDAVHDSAVGTDGALVMAEAHSAQPTAVADADAVRLAANVYGQLILAGYTWATNSLRTTETNPLSSQHSEITLASASSQGNGTTAYYVDMDGYSTLSLHIEDTPGVAGDQTYTVLCSIEDNGTAPASVDYIDCGNAVYGAASWTTDAMLLDTNHVLGQVKYVKVNVVRANDGGNTDGAWEIFAKKKQE